jgi:NhaP-type Na+/H+ or K+/H+ antiporter
MVVFLVLLDLVKGIELSVGDIVWRFVRLSFGGPILGLLGGMILSFVLSRTHNNFVLEVNATVVMAYLVFFIAEVTPVHVSGILALVTLGLYMSRSGRVMISAESEHSVHHVWGYIGFLAETVIFILTGLIFGERVVLESSSIVWQDIVKLLFGVYPILMVIRFLVNFMFWPILRKMGYGMSFKEVLLSTYAGLRGAVGMSLALMVLVEPTIDYHIQDVILIHVGGLAMLTLIINATTTGTLVNKLGLTKESDIQKNILYGIAVKIQSDTDDTIEILKTKRHYNQVDWDELRQNVTM